MFKKIIDLSQKDAVKARRLIAQKRLTGHEIDGFIAVDVDELKNAPALKTGRPRKAWEDEK